jgi:ubiquinone/menaquinone biosynthesis C-methylase UbiE
VIPLTKLDRYRAIYQEMNPGYKHSGSIYEGLVKRCLNPEARVLDAGCGRGGVIELYTERVRQTVGLDTDLSSLQEHRCLKQRVVGSLANMPFPGEFFDVVLCSWVVEHLEEPEAVFREMARVLKKRGYLLLLTPNAWGYVILVNRLIPAPLHRWLVRAIYGRQSKDTFPPFYRANSKGRLEMKLHQVGLRNEEFYYVGDPSYIAFNDIFFKLGVLLERLTDWPSLRPLKVHLVASYLKEER